MQTHRTPRRPGSRIVPVAVAVALLWGGCSVERDRELLSVFFDGVPGPDASSPATGVGARGAAPTGRTFAGAVSRHSAYIDRRCADCHGDRARFGFQTEGFTNLTAAVCVGCHEPALERPHLHGPVALGSCLVCHTPHVSRHPALLVRESPALCLGCHVPGDQGQMMSAAHEDATRDCLECHYGHGGDDPYFLRPPGDGG